MTQTAAAVDRDLLDIIFGPATERQTYLNLLYLLLAFPLGIAYFVFLITGVSVGAGLLVVFINVIGGMIVGIAQQGLPFSEAVRTYTALTVGDGLTLARKR